jgi:para-aminobenzoate synthetase component I
MISKRIFTEFPVDNFEQCKQRLLIWASRFSSCCFLDNNGYNMPGRKLECLAGAGAIATLLCPSGSAFDALKDFHDQWQDWIFGHLGYDLKNELEGLSSVLPDPANFPDLHFFVPSYVVQLSHDVIRIGTLTDEPASDVWLAIQETEDQPGSYAPMPPLKSRFSKSAYLEAVGLIQQHMKRGDCYELTFCQEFYMEPARPDPVSVFRRLSELSPHPHAAYYGFGEHFLLCSSPERFLQHHAGRLLSQPIKGTARRRPSDPDRDKASREALGSSPKERSENMMIVDLVRNDLSRISAEGSVRVTELGEIYAFPRVFQMISSIEGQLDTPYTWIDALKATFPMGSMTGAPKKRVMELIERYERTKRGIYSGAIGYIDPEGNFDFGVVIRSILFNRSLHYLSFLTGSAITSASDPVKEYSECLLKAQAMVGALNRSAVGPLPLR